VDPGTEQKDNPMVFPRTLVWEHALTSQAGVENARYEIREKAMRTHPAIITIRSNPLLLILSIGAYVASFGCSDDNGAQLPADAAITQAADSGSKDEPMDATPQDAELQNAIDAQVVSPIDSAADSAQPIDVSLDTGVDTTPNGIAVAGTWLSNFGGYEEITNTNWDEALLVEYDNISRIAYTQNTADDVYNPSKFNKIVWTALAGGSFYYCTVDYGLDSLAAAKSSAKTAEASAPDTSGCGGFSWTKLTKTAALEISGTWSSNFGGAETLSSIQWNDMTVVDFDNTADTAFTQNSATATYGPNTFNKIVWTKIVGNSFYYCTVDYSLTSLAAAKASTKAADATNPDIGGCGGFSWTKLTKL
jgi:hypothetical protein